MYGKVLQIFKHQALGLLNMIYPIFLANLILCDYPFKICILLRNIIYLNINILSVKVLLNYYHNGRQWSWKNCIIYKFFRDEVVQGANGLRTFYDKYLKYGKLYLLLPYELLHHVSNFVSVPYVSAHLYMLKGVSQEN